MTPITAKVITVAFTLAEAQALEWIADAGLEQLTADNNVKELSRDINVDLANASDGVAMLQKALKEFHEKG